MAEDPPRSPRVPSPRLNVLRVRPHQIRHRPFMWDLLLAVEQSHLVDGGEVGGQASVHTQDRAVDDSPEREEIEGLVEIFPTVRVAVFLVDLVQEAIHHGHVATLVVPPQQVDPIGMHDFQTEQKRNGLHRVVPPIHKIPNHDELATGDTPTQGE